MGGIRENAASLLDNRGMTHYSPLRYPGGKAKLANFVKDVYRHNNLCDGTYVEPYAGGAAIALTLLLEEYAREIVINDLDYSVFSFWKTVLDDTEDFIRKICDTNITIDEWRKQQFVYKNQAEFSRADIGFAFFFLNRTNRSGVINAGIIGGLQQTGNYKADVRFNKKDLIARVELIASHRSRIKVYNLDAMKLIPKVTANPKPKTFVYMDPPYYDKGKMLYKNFYAHDDHVQIGDVANELKVPAIITYDNVEPIKQIYKKQKQLEFSLYYSLHNDKKRTATELMIYKHLELPYHPNHQA